MASQSPYSPPYSTGGPVANSPSAGAPSANGANRSALGTLIIRPLPAEEGAQTREIVLDGQDVAIGRSPACDVVLEGDQLVSRRHALLRYNGTLYTLVDLGSSNGTFINDTEIHQTTPLNDGDLIMIGEHEMVYSLRPAGGLAPSLGQSMGQDQRAAAESASYPSPGSVSASQLFDVSAAQTLLDPHQGTQSPAWQDPAWAQSSPSQAQSVQSMQPMQPAMSATLAPQLQQAQPQPPAQPQAQQSMQSMQSTQPQVSQPGAQPDQAFGSPVRGTSTGNMRNTSAYLQAVRSQLDEANQRLAQAEEEESRLLEVRRAGMIEVRDRLNAILAEQRRGPSGGYGAGSYGTGTYGSSEAASPNTANTAGLITLARQTEQNPRHIDFVMQLASRAGEIASALETAQSRPVGPASPGGASQALLAQLEALRARLDELIG